MCGIAVILPGSAIDLPPFAIDRMTAALAHRGPDARQIVRLPGCHLGHTRLSIIDIEGGAQPMADPTGRFTLVFNGEIYNHRELRRELEADDCIFRTRSDTEVLLQGYIRHGSAVIPRLNGQFALAVWDARDRTLFAARDRFGEKPLFWARGSRGELLLASEIKSILASGLFSPRIDPLAVDAYLGLFYVPPHRSIYENIHPLPPAHEIAWHAAGQAQERYWTPRYSCNDVDKDEAVAQIRTLIDKAVDRQCVADVPVGAFLSGGLDSTTVVAHMARQSRQPVQTFSIGFGDLIDELPFARDVAAMYRTRHRELQMDIGVVAMLDAMSEVYDEPFADSSNIPTYLVAQHARKQVKVVLSGDGADEIFGGYSWYEKSLQSPRGQEAWKTHVSHATSVLLDRSALWDRVLQPAAAKDIREHYHDAAARDLDAATHFDLSCYLSGDILVKVDRAAMAHGLEVRTPFLDADLADFVIGLPWQLRFGGKLKYLLRAACGNMWPLSVQNRNKQGFGAPVRNWIEQPSVREIWHRVSRKNSPLLALLPGLPRIVEELRPQRKWSLLCLGIWLEKRTECLARLAA